MHGTHCAGTLVGGNASGAWIGVAPDAELAAALVLNGENGGTDAQILAGIQWAVEQQVEIISMSLGGLVLDPETPPTYTEAIVTALMAGIPVVTAIGNEGSQTTGSPGNDLFAFAVGATDHATGWPALRRAHTHHSEVDFIQPDLLPLPYSKPDVSAPAWRFGRRCRAESGPASAGRRWRPHTSPRRASAQCHVDWKGRRAE